MSSSPADAFYEGRGIPVELNEVEDALDRLWGPAAEKAGGPELDDPAVTRVVLANVVLVHLGPDRPGMDATIGAITTQYPSRLILLRPSAGGGRRLSAEVSAQCHLPAPGRPQVCSEQIVLRAGPEGLDLLPGAVRSLRESDLHSVLWWCDDPRQAQHYRRCRPNRCICRCDRDDQGSKTHQQYREHQGISSAVMVGEVPEQPPADRTHHEAGGKQQRGVQLLHNRISAGEERLGEIERKRGVRVKVVPLDQIADRPDEYRFQSATDVDQAERTGLHRDLMHVAHHT